VLAGSRDSLSGPANIQAMMWPRDEEEKKKGRSTRGFTQELQQVFHAGGTLLEETNVIFCATGVSDHASLYAGGEYPGKHRGDSFHSDACP